MALELAEELDALGHVNRVLALVPAEGGATDPQLPPLVHRSRIGTSTRVECTWRLRGVLREERYDVVLAHGGWPAQVAALSVPRGGPFLVWQRILGFPTELWGGPRQRLWQAVARRVDAAVALTPADEAEMRKLGFEGPVWVIPNFRRPGRFLAVDREAASASLRSELGVDDEVGLVGFVGHLVAQKRPERTLDVLAQLHRRGLRVHLVVAGDGPLLERMEQLVHEQGLIGYVSLLGHRRDVELIFGGVDLAVLTSDVEGMPGVAIEAQMAGCPLVTFPVGGVKEVVEDGVTGSVLVRPDTTLMADQVARLLTDVRARTEMGKAARLRGTGFTARRSAVKYEAQLLASLERSASRHPSPRWPRRRLTTSPLEDRLPNLFIIGAPKAGTTFVHQALRLAPGVYMSEVKEPGFFTSREHRLGLDHYVGAYFRGAQGHAVRGESTPWYLYSEDALRRIAALPLPPPKLLVLVRRPADRALSMYRDQVRTGRDDRSFGEAVEAELDALAQGALGTDLRQRYVWCGHYSEHIRRWQDAFGAAAVEVVVFEDLADDPSAVWARIGSLLEHDLGRPTFARVSERDRNPSGDLRWPRLDRALRSLEGREHPVVELVKAALPPGMHRRLLQKVGRINRQAGEARALEIDEVALAALDAHFAEEHEVLEALLGRRIDAWRQERPSG